jgi:hypothetical protein
MIRRRTWLRIISLFGLLLVLLGGYGYFSWTRLLERQHIRQVDWQGPSLSLDGLHLARLELLQLDADGSLRIEAEQLRLGWRQFGSAPPFWQHIRLGRLALDWRPTEDRASAAPRDTPADLQPLAAVLAWLPLGLRIDQLSANLPCASGHCTLHGDLLLTRQRPAPVALDLQLNLLSGADRLAWNVQLRGTADALQLQLGLTVNQQPQLGLHSSLRSSPEGVHWGGSLSAPSLSEAVALQRWLSQWALAPGTQLPSAPSAAQLAANWQLQLAPGTLSLERLREASGHFDASAVLAEPWPIPAIGQLQGHFAIAARGVAGQWFAERLETDLQLEQLSADWLEQLPPPLRADSLHLYIQPASPLAELPSGLVERSLPLTIDLSGRGATRFDLHASLALANAPPWAVQLAAARLTGSSRNLAVEGWKARELNATLALRGYLDSEQLRLELLQGSRFDLGELGNGDLHLHLQGVDGQLQGLQLQAQHRAGSVHTWQVAGPVTLSMQRLEQAALKPQGWRWQGTLATSQERLELDGRLSADADLHLAVQLHHDSSRGLHLQAQLAELFLRAGNPLAKTLADWPTLLDLNDGRLNANASLALAPGRDSPEVQLELTGKGLAGIYDRTLLNGLDSRAQFKLEHQQLQLELTELRLEQANPGLPIGPLELRGHYRAPLAQPSKGMLQLHQAQTAVMGGTLRLSPGQWDLAQDSLLFPLELQGLQLEQLFTLYPAEGLAGTGTLDGQLPLRVGASGIHIERGQLAARAPGGHLQFHSERIRALGRSNPAMQLVTQSLEDFRFTTLNSRVDYDPQGKLRLAMRLEGQNPAIEQGRPIHFNIDLEEDIPSLLASLQLTDKVSDIIKQRVQQRMLQRNAAPAREP